METIYDLTVLAEWEEPLKYVTTSLVGNITDGFMFIRLENNGQLVLNTANVISLSFVPRAVDEQPNDSFVSELQKGATIPEKKGLYTQEGRVNR